MMVRFIDLKYVIPYMPDEMSLYDIRATVAGVRPGMLGLIDTDMERCNLSEYRSYGAEDMVELAFSGESCWVAADENDILNGSYGDVACYVVCRTGSLILPALPYRRRTNAGVRFHSMLCVYSDYREALSVMFEMNPPARGRGPCYVRRVW